MGDVCELVGRQELLPDRVVADLRPRIGGDWPEDDGRGVERGEGVSVGDVDRIVDHDVDRPGWRIPDERHDLAAKRLHPASERDRPLAVRRWIVKDEVFGPNGVPVEPWPRRWSLRARSGSQT